MHKKAFIWSGVVLVVVLGIIFARSQSMVGVSAIPTTGTTPVSFTSVAQGPHSDVSRRANFSITSTEQLSALWKMIDTTEDRPDVDFSRDIVIAVFMGTEPSLGYSISVTKVSDSGKRVVAVTLSTPGGSCAVGDSVTNPYQIIIVPKTTLSFTHTDQETTVSCLQ